MTVENFEWISSHHLVFERLPADLLLVQESTGIEIGKLESHGAGFTLLQSGTFSRSGIERTWIPKVASST